jgi:hypothetical protein
LKDAFVENNDVVKLKLVDTKIVPIPSKELGDAEAILLINDWYSFRKELAGRIRKHRRHIRSLARTAAEQLARTRRRLAETIRTDRRRRLAAIQSLKDEVVALKKADVLWRKRMAHTIRASRRRQLQSYLALKNQLAKLKMENALRRKRTATTVRAYREWQRTVTAAVRGEREQCRVDIRNMQILCVLLGALGYSLGILF